MQIGFNEIAVNGMNFLQYCSFRITLSNTYIFQLVQLGFCVRVRVGNTPRSNVVGKVIPLMTLKAWLKNCHLSDS